MSHIVMSMAFSHKVPYGFNIKEDMEKLFFQDKKKKQDTRFDVYLKEVAPVVVLVYLHNLFDIYCGTGLLTEPSRGRYPLGHLRMLILFASMLMSLFSWGHVS